MKCIISPHGIALAAAAAVGLLVAGTFAVPSKLMRTASADVEALRHARRQSAFDAVITRNAETMLEDGRRIFRFDTFGSEAFWGDQLQLHKAIAGAANGGVGPGVSPRTALALGLKVDAGALPHALLRRIRTGRINLDSPAVTLELLRRDAVVGVKGFFNGTQLRAVGLQCSVCHSTVDNSVTFGIGQRLDGWPNRDLDVGKIAASAPDLSPFASLLGISQDTVRQVFNSWGPGKFDAQLILDGKARRPDGQPAATLIPPAFGLAGVNNHTWTGAWGTVTYWNAFVANLEMQGKGTFFDPRLDDAEKFPVAARAGFGQKRDTPDLITSKLPALHFYQLAIPAPEPRRGADFDPAAARRGETLFTGQARCSSCHVPPLFTEPGWNLHKPEEIGIDDFQANRSPDNRYRTAPLKGIFTRERGLFMRPENAGRFYHDGRFRRLLDVVNHYDSFFGLGLTPQGKGDLVEYLKSL